MTMKDETADEQESTTKKRLLPGGGTRDVAGRISDSNKKTRDLPNLSECQACGFRIDSCSSGNSKIQILYSEWRILLLCNKCHYRVESCQICSYCFNETRKDFLTCCQCKRCVHKNCFLKCKTVAPWSYSSCSVGFSICVDCWVPNSLMKRWGFLSCGKNSANCADLGDSNSRVLNGGGGNCVVERKIVVALRARGMVERKAVGAERAKEMEYNAVDLGVKKDANGENGKMVTVEDAELAFQLHRTMNSSPRISKNLCLNSSSSHVSKKQDCDGALILGGSESGNPSVCLDLEVCTDKKLNKNMDRSILDPLISINSEDLALSLKEGEGSCSNNALKSSGDEFGSRSSHNNQYESTSYNVEMCNGKSDRFLLKYRKRNSSSKSVVDNTSKVEISNGMCDRFLLKYRKRNLSFKSILDNKSEIEICNGKSDRFLLKYRKRNSSSNSVLGNKSKVEICYGKPDRFLLKYRKRNSSSKPVLDSESKVEICLGKPDHYLLKYRKRNSSSKGVQDDKSKILSEILSSPVA